MKIGVMSASRIVAEFLKHLNEMPDIEVTAMCVRPQSEQKARDMLVAAGVADATLYTDYEAFLADPGYDFVYNGTANHLHYPQTKQALLAGRNVILEKPFTVTLAQAEELFAIAQEKGLWLWEAITTPYQPGFGFMKENLGKIGPVHGLTVNFSKYSTRYDDYLAGRWNTTFDPACAGGALMDMNMYCIYFAVLMFGEPQGAVYMPNVGKNGVDTGGVAVLDYPGFRATLISCKDSHAPMSVVVQGEKGYLESPCAVGVLEKTCAVVGKERAEGPVPQLHRMTYEFNAFAELWKNGDRAACEDAKQNTLRVMRILDKLQKAIPAYAEKEVKRV